MPYWAGSSAEQLRLVCWVPIAVDMPFILGDSASCSANLARMNHNGAFVKVESFGESLQGGDIKSSTPR